MMPLGFVIEQSSTFKNHARQLLHYRQTRKSMGMIQRSILFGFAHLAIKSFTIRAATKWQKTVSIKNIRSELKVHRLEIDKMSTSYGAETISKHFQVLRVSNHEWYYLNSELVPNTIPI